MVIEQFQTRHIPLISHRVCNEQKTAKDWLRMIIRRFYGTINIAEKNYFDFDFSAAPLIFRF